MPDRNALVSNVRSGKGELAELAEAAFGRDGGSRARDIEMAIADAATFSSAAVQAAPITPTRSTRINSAAKTPVTAPSVFQPYKRPSAAPKRCPSRDQAPTR